MEPCTSWAWTSRHLSPSPPASLHEVSAVARCPKVLENLQDPGNFDEIAPLCMGIYGKRARSARRCILLVCESPKYEIRHLTARTDRTTPYHSNPPAACCAGTLNGCLGTESSPLPHKHDKNAKETSRSGRHLKDHLRQSTNRSHGVLDGRKQMARWRIHLMAQIGESRALGWPHNSHGSRPTSAAVRQSFCGELIVPPRARQGLVAKLRTLVMQRRIHICFR